MGTQVEFINDNQIKVITSRGEELIGTFTMMPANTDEVKREVIKVVGDCFDSCHSCAQAIDCIQILVLKSNPMLLMGLYFEFLITPIEAQRKRIGKRIREIRELRGVSARELAFDCHIDPSNLSKIESGKHAAGLDILNRIAYFLDAEVQINLKPNTERKQTEFPRILDTMM